MSNGVNGKTVGRPSVVENAVVIGVTLSGEVVDLIDKESVPEYRSRSAQVRKIIDAYYYDMK